MAETYTLAGAQAQADLAATAIRSHDWAGAVEAIALANLILSMLPVSTADGPQAATMRVSLKDAADLVKAALSATNSEANNTRRLIRAGVRHQSRGSK